jgi:hypothetical protein
MSDPATFSKPNFGDLGRPEPLHKALNDVGQPFARVKAAEEIRSRCPPRKTKTWEALCRGIKLSADAEPIRQLNRTILIRIGAEDARSWVPD